MSYNEPKGDKEIIMLVCFILGIAASIIGMNIIMDQYYTRKMNKIINRRIKAEGKLKRTMLKNGINIPGL